MNALKGTLRLLRLNVRLDRIKLVIWLAAIVGLVALTLPELVNAYGTPAKQLGYASATAPSMVTRLLSGAITGPTIGEISVIETFALVALLVALMNVFMVTKHTRYREESGQSELIGAMVVGRQANLTAVLIEMLLVNVLVSGLLYGVFIYNDFSATGSLAYCLGVSGIGLFFASVSAVTAQLFENARTANSLAGLVFGISFLLRGVGDAFGSVNPDGVSVTASWLSWASPLGWATNMLPFHAERWWALGLFGAFTLGLVGLAYGLLAKRDVGAGIFASKNGRAHATVGLLKEFGLLWRLNRVAFFAWLTGCMVMGAAIGGVANEFTELIAQNEEMQQMLASLGQAEDPTDLLFSATFTIAGITLAAYGLQLLLRMRSEETSGRLELVLSGPLSRPRWMLRSVIFTVVTAVLILFATGVSAGFVYGLIDGDVLSKTLRLGVAILVHAPALLVVLGCGLLAFSLLPRLAAIISWAVLGGCLLIVQLGVILGLPSWVTNLSPFSHTPPAPAADVTTRPLYTLGLIAIGLLLVAVVCFRHRDLITE